MNYLNIVLYGLLGGLLSHVGVGVLEKPLEFFAILILVLLIEFNGK